MSEILVIVVVYFFSFLKIYFYIFIVIVNFVIKYYVVGLREGALKSLSI